MARVSSPRRGVERPAMTWLKGYVSGSGGGDTQAPSAPARSHRAVDDREFHLAGVDRVDGQRGCDGLPDPARARREWRHVRADRHLDDQLRSSTRVSRRAPTFRYQVRAVDAAGNASAVSNTVTAATQAGGGDTQAPSVRRESGGAVDDDDFGVARVDRIDGQRGRDGLSDPARAGRKRRHVHRRSQRRRPLATSTQVSRRTPPTATRCEPPTRPETCRRCRTR